MDDSQRDALGGQSEAVSPNTVFNGPCPSGQPTPTPTPTPWGASHDCRRTTLGYPGCSALEEGGAALPDASVEDDGACGKRKRASEAASAPRAKPKRAPPALAPLAL